MNIVICFASEKFKISQELLKNESYKYGADKVICYTSDDISESFVKKNIKILQTIKGNGLWLWKPYLILKTLLETNDGDKILYSDSGAYPINNLSSLFDLVNKEDIALFSLSDKLNKNWTKRSCFKIMECEDDKYFECKQTLASFQIYKNSRYSKKFVAEYLKYCEIFENISDSKDILDNNNYFVEHRYDQSILSNLSIKYEISRYRDPSQFGEMLLCENSKFPVVFNHHRGNL